MRGNVRICFENNKAHKFKVSIGKIAENALGQNSICTCFFRQMETIQNKAMIINLGETKNRLGAKKDPHLGSLAVSATFKGD